MIVVYNSEEERLCRNIRNVHDIKKAHKWISNHGKKSSNLRMKSWQLVCFY